MSVCIKTIIVMYLVCGYFSLYKKYNDVKKNFEENNVPKDIPLDEFKKRFEISLVYDHPETQKIYRASLDAKDFLNIFFLWPNYLFGTKK